MYKAFPARVNMATLAGKQSRTFLNWVNSTTRSIDFLVPRSVFTHRVSGHIKSRDHCTAMSCLKKTGVTLRYQQDDSSWKTETGEWLPLWWSPKTAETPLFGLPLRLSGLKKVGGLLMKPESWRFSLTASLALTIRILQKSQNMTMLTQKPETPEWLTSLKLADFYTVGQAN